ncbi:TetR/AcrR family transcriptional regulator [Defluviimonas sp. SAOS-178_SWC]|uniref:TetR/AcrR family transcriptional regulator n=1 Tax=Defluviimonas sp. SAOS-178_SWC TaxID=3121287 RepID=UPI0032220C14
MNQSLRDELKARKQAFVQDEITSAAADLFASGGYRTVTIDDIAAQLGYTKSVVYYYFKDKNEVLWTIFNQIHDSWAHDMDDILASDVDAASMLWQMIRKHALNVLERTAWSAIYFREQGNLNDDQKAIVEKRSKVFNDNFRKVYRRGVEEGQFKDIPTPLIIGGIIGMCNWTHDWYKKDGGLKAEQIAEHFADILLNGCKV